MSYTTVMLLQGLVLGVVVVASNPSPHFAALGLAFASGAGCGLMVIGGGTFLSLVFFLIYLGGMLVVFAYCSALAADPYPETLGNPQVLFMSVAYGVAIAVGVLVVWKSWPGGAGVIMEGGADFSPTRGEVEGVATMYSWGGWMLVVAAWALLLVLLVVLEVVRGASRGALRAV